MNQWRITYLYEGWHTEIVWADYIDLAIAHFHRDHPLVPGIAIEKVECVK